MLLNDVEFDTRRLRQMLLADGKLADDVAAGAQKRL
jgi:hypothetical protein